MFHAPEMPRPPTYHSVPSCFGLTTWFLVIAAQILTLRYSRFFHYKLDGTPQAQTVFCSPSIEAFNVEAFVNLNNASLFNIVPLSNSLTAAFLSNQPYNGSVAYSVLSSATFG